MRGCAADELEWECPACLELGELDDHLAELDSLLTGTRSYQLPRLERLDRLRALVEEARQLRRVQAAMAGAAGQRG